MRFSKALRLLWVMVGAGLFIAGVAAASGAALWLFVDRRFMLVVYLLAAVPFWLGGAWCLKKAGPAEDDDWLVTALVVCGVIAFFMLGLHALTSGKLPDLESRLLGRASAARSHEER